MACCGNQQKSYNAGSAAGQVRVNYIGEAATKYVKVFGSVTKTSYGYKVVGKSFCMHPKDAEAEPALYEVIGPCVG